MGEARITKRRALAARLLAVAFPIAALGAPVGTAVAAAPVTPKLVATNPESSESATATATLPSVLGEAEPEDGIILERAPFFMASRAMMGTRAVEKPTAHPNYEIKIFEAPECHGEVFAHGSAELLEGVGIPVSVPANFATTFSAIQIDPSNPSEPSACSNPLIYWEGSVAGSQGGSPTGEGGEATGTGGSGSGSGESASSGATKSPKSPGSIGSATPAGGKPEAPQIHTNPGGRADDLTPFVVGSAPGSSSVSVYASSNCSGTPVAKGTPTELSSGFAVSVAPNAETVFSAVSVGAQRSSCSSSVAYTEDSTAPRTRVTMGPGVKTRKHTAVFRFKDVTTDPPGTTFVCKVDLQKWKHCASPFHAKHLKLGSHTVRIRATDLAGNVERHPVKRSFRVVPRP
jgi:hypothetical protein